MTKPCTCGVLLALMAISASGRAAENLGPVTLTGTEHYVLHSDELDLDYRIDVALPIGYSTSKIAYPVVYVTDGNFLLPIVMSSTRLMQLTGELPPVILVGIGYRVANPMAVGSLRNRDLTPTFDKAWVEEARSSPGPFPPTVDPGGAPAFAELIERRVKPLIREKYRVDPDDETLVGYSLGGLFTLYVLLNHSDTYDRYLAGSPSLWWDDRVTFTYEEQYARTHDDLPKRVFMSVGSLEETAGSEESRMVSNADEMYRRLLERKYPGLHIEHQVLEDETHTSGISSSMVRGLRSLFADHARATETAAR